MAQAVAFYHAESNKKPGKKPMSLQMVCKSVSDDYFACTKICVPLDHKTLLRLASGGITLTESNSKKSWLTKEENEVIVQFTIDMAHHGFPLSPKCLHEHAECILRHCLGDRFPDTGLGKNWATHFITRHHGRVGMYWSSALDTSCGWAVNLVTKEEYFRILKEVQDEYNIPDELAYDADETGIQTGTGTTERVIGPAGASIQYRQQNCNRENITVLPTICADGTSVPPTVIYKGESFQAKWLQENPLDVRYALLL